MKWKFGGGGRGGGDRGINHDFVGDSKDIPDRLCQTYPWAPSCDPETVSIRRSMASPGPSAHLDDIDL
jgi:hypothetical protein